IEWILRVVVGSWKRSHDVVVRIVFDDPSGMSAGWAAHKRGEKSAVMERSELVGDRRFGRIVGAGEAGMTRLTDIEKENLRLAAQKAEKAAESESAAVTGKSGVVRLVADGSCSECAGRER